MPNIREMQTRLSQWATDHPGESYRDLWNLICSPAWLEEAYSRIKGNTGANTPGIDRETRVTWDEHLSDRIELLRRELLDGSYQPQPCRRVYIPKKDGKKRPLGIPAIRDRVVQEAIRLAIEPIYEADFLNYSFGFRPKRATHDAAAWVRCWMMANKRMRYVIEGDIKAYFDTIHHQKLMSLLRRRIKDKHVLEVIWRFLKAGIMHEGQFAETSQGTPQGGVISPLLANIYLHELDRYLHERFLGSPCKDKTKRRRQGGYNIGYVRYADDFVVFCNGGIKDVEQLKDDIAAFLWDELHLTLSPEKTLVTHVTKGFDFLGFQFFLGKDGLGLMKPKVRIPFSRIEAVKEKIKRITAKNQFYMDEATILRNLNSLLRGWGNYYVHVPASKTFGTVDYYAYWRLVGWFRRKHNWSTAQVMKHRQNRVRDDLRLSAQWNDKDGNYRSIRLFYLARDVKRREANGRKIPNPYLPVPPDMNGKSKWKAGCAETCMSGLGGGMEKPATER